MTFHFHPSPAHQARAAERGLTRILEVEVAEWSLRVAVAEDVDLDGAFHAVCLDTGADLILNGWMIG